MATLENFDARSLALNFEPILRIKQAIDQNKNRQLAERKLILDEEIRRGTLDVAEADLILRQEASQLAGDKFEAEQTSQQGIQETLAQLISPTQAPAGQPAQADAGGVQAPVVQPSRQPQTAPAVDLAKREKLLIKLSGIKGGPAIVKAIEPLLKSRDTRAKDALAKEIEGKQAFALSLSRMDTREKQDRAIDNEIAKQSRAGELDPFLAELRNMNPADREQELFLDMAQGDVLKDLVKNELADPTFQSKIGKQAGDRNTFVGLFGKGSPQVRAFDEAVKSEAKGEVKLSDVKGIRGDFTNLSKEFVKIGDAFKKVNSSKGTPAGDLSLIFNFMKILDPTSVVREGEFATAASAGPLVDAKTIGLYNRIIKGDRLLPIQRKDFKATAKEVFSSQIGAQLTREEEFRGIAKRAGINPKDVVLDFIGPFRKIGGTTKIGRFKVKVK